MPKQGEEMTLANTEAKFVFLTTHKTVTHKLFHSPRSYFCTVTACAGDHTTMGSPSSFTNWIIIIVIIMICDPYFFLVRRDSQNSDTFWHVYDRESPKLSGPMAKFEASSKNLRRLSKCTIQFQMMFFESLSHSYFSNGISAAGR